MGDLSLDAVWSRYQRAKQRRRCWEGLWRECYTYALPQRGTGFGAEFRPGANLVERLFDGTALYGVEQLGASLLADLRARIRHTLLIDRLGPTSGPRTTATEVVERASETTRLLGATYGRLQAELLTPLLTRAVTILRRRGEIPDLALDGRTVDLQYKSPLARTQARQDVRETLLWLDATAQMGPQGAAVVDRPATARWLGDRLGVPGHLMHDFEAPALLADVALAALETAPDGNAKNAL